MALYVGNTRYKSYLGNEKKGFMVEPIFDGWVYDNGVWKNKCVVLERGTTRIQQGENYLYTTTAAELWIDTPVVIQSGKQYTVTAKITYCSNAATNHYSALMAYDADAFTSLMAYNDTTYRKLNQVISDGITTDGYYILSTYINDANKGIKTAGNEGKRICIHLNNFYGTKYYTELKIEVT